MLDRYVAQVRLLVSVLPDIAQETAFALKESWPSALAERGWIVKDEIRVQSPTRARAVGAGTRQPFPRSPRLPFALSSRLFRP